MDKEGGEEGSDKEDGGWLGEVVCELRRVGGIEVWESSSASDFISVS